MKTADALMNGLHKVLPCVYKGEENSFVRALGKPSVFNSSKQI